MPWACMQRFSFIPLMISEEKIFEYVFENLPFMLPWQPIKFRDLDKIHMNRRGLLKKHICKKNLNICSETAEIANFHFSHYKSMETIICHSNQSSYPIGTKKTILFIPPTYRCYVWNMARIGFMASEEMSFENVDDGWLHKIMLLYFILRYICLSMIYQCFKAVYTVCTRMVWKCRVDDAHGLL